MKTIPLKTNKSTWLAAAIGWALLILFALPQTVSAQQWTTNGNDISNTNSGNVGVGLTTPLYKFDVLSGTNILARFGSTASAHTQVLFNAPTGYNSNLALQNGGVSKWYLGNRAANDRFSFIESTGTVEVFSILQNGNVGIGTTSPYTRLTTIGVSGEPTLTHNTAAIASFLGASAGNELVVGASSNSPYAIWLQNRNFYVDGGAYPISLNPLGGNVGIGTTTPGTLNGTTFSTVGLHAFKGNNSSYFAIDSSGAGSFSGLLLNRSGASANNRMWVVDAQPNADQTSSVLAFSTYTDAGMPTSRMLIDRSGNVGIGTAAPSAKLDVGGHIHALGVCGGGVPNAQGAYLTWNQYCGTGETDLINHQGAGTGGFAFMNTTNGTSLNTLMFITATGKVGIGTTGPSTLLHVGAGGDSPLVGVSAIYATNAGATNIAVRDSTSDVEGMYYAYSGGVLFGAVTNHSAIIRTNNLDRITVTSGGNVGIGLVPASGNKLDVAGNINASGTISATALNINNSPVTSSQWTTNGSTINYTGGNIGIGATSPQSRLSINTSTQSPGSMLEINNRGDLAAGSWSAIRFGLDSNSYPNQYAKGGIVYESRDGYNRGKLHLVVNTAANTANMSLSDALLTVDGTTGNVGIGSTTPASKLDVAGNVNATGTISATGLNINGSPVTSSQWTTNGSNISYSVTNGNVGIGTPPASGNKLDVAGNGHFSGNVTVDGNIAAKYQDMAEWVPSSEQLSTGTVVVLDSTKSNQVISSTQAYDTRVAGVISEQPGIALGESGAGKVLVATTGRVLVKVEASKSPIHIGDLLVTSDVPGVAMKSEPVNLDGVQFHRPGTLIGKALEPLEKGKGKILVLLSLQ